MKRVAYRGWVVGVFLLAATSAWAQTPDAAYQQEFQKWQQEQIRDLKENWLPLVGLFWLKEGDNILGSDKDAAISIERSYLLGREGVFRLRQESVWFEAVPGSSVRLGNASFKEAMLVPSPPGPATVLEAGPLRMSIIKRGKRFGVRVKDLNSPAVREFKGLQTYPLDQGYIVTAELAPAEGKTMAVPNVLGDVQQLPVAGEARFRMHGKALRLKAIEGSDGTLFFVFSDLTKKKGTYPGGRFLDAEASKNGKVVLDFNKAYSPPCAWTPYATCPLPPKENQLQVEIPAGEKYAGHR